jgi:hypothetical protein
MVLVSLLVRFCFIAVAVVLHCSLLFCTGSHCVYPVDGNLLIARAALHFPSEFFDMIPTELKTLQLLAQWLIIVEAVFVIHFGFTIMKKIISLILEITFATIILAAVCYFYNQNTNDPKKTEARLREMLNIAKNLINLLHWIIAKIK